MKILVFFASLIFAVFASATTLEDINIIPSDKNIEIVLFLDSAFDDGDSKVVARDDEGFGTLILKNIKYNKNKVATQTKLIPRLEIFGQNGDVYIVFVISDFSLKFDTEVKSSDKILRILLSPKNSITSMLLNTQDSRESNPSAINAINAKDSRDLDSRNARDSQNPKNPRDLEDSISAIKNATNAPQTTTLETWRYMLVVGILIALLVSLVILKRKALKKGSSTAFPYFNNLNFRISQIIDIDVKNKIVVLDSSDIKYLLLVGANGSFVIDKIEKNEIEPKKIENLLNQKETKLSYLIKAYDDEKTRA